MFIHLDIHLLQEKNTEILKILKESYKINQARQAKTSNILLEFI